MMESEVLIAQQLGMSDMIQAMTNSLRVSRRKTDLKIPSLYLEKS